MSRSASIRSVRQSADPAVTVALHHVAGRWRAVTLRREQGEARLLETKLFGAAAAGSGSGAGEHREIQHWLEGQHPGRVVAVLPASRIICRACPLPKGTPERLQTALDLQAEAHLLGAVPRHRLATTVLPAAPGDAGRTGLLIGWPEGAAPAPTPLSPGSAAAASGFDLLWTADVAALAALLGTQRPEGSLLWVDRGDGSVAIVLCGPASANAPPGAVQPALVFRATREEFAGDDEWQADVRRVVAETALSADLSAAAVRAAMPALDAQLATAAGSAFLLLPESVRDATRDAVAGVPADGAWWNEYGVALGAALCASGELAPLARLRESPQRERPTIVARMASSLATPRTAVLLGVLAAVMIAMGPLAFARVRLGLLESKVANLDELRGRNAEDMQRRAMYRELGAKSWPVTKLAGDIANCMPDGIELTSIDISRTQGIALVAIARPGKDKSGKDQLAGDRVTEMTKLMDDSGLFHSVVTRREPGAIAGNEKVTITAKVRDAYRPVKWDVVLGGAEEDFAVTSMADRKSPKSSRKPANGAVAAGHAPSRANAGAAEHDAAGGDELVVARAPEGEDGVNAASDIGRGVEGVHAAGSPDAEPASTGGRARRAVADGSRGARPPLGGAAATAEGAAAETPGGDADARPDDAAKEGEAAEGASEQGVRHAGPARRSFGDSGSDGGAAKRSGRTGIGGSVVPDPLSQDEINAKSPTELQEALSRISEARNNPGVDDSTKERLKKEFYQILQRQREMKK